MALRRLRVSLGQNLFNIGALATGISTFTLLLFYVQKEEQFDRFHDYPGQLYRIINEYHIGDDSGTNAWIPPSLGPALSEVPQVKEAVRLFRYRSPCLIVNRDQDIHFVEENSIWADPNIFKVFHFDILRGDPGQALVRPHTMALSESAAKKYFGDRDPIGKTLHDLTMESEFEITAVYRDMPDASHFRADFLCSLNTLPELWGSTILESWGNSFLYTYIRLKDGAKIPELGQRINALAGLNNPPTAQATSHFELQKVTDIHLHSNVLNEWGPNTDIRYIYILSFVGVLILIVSAINFTTLWIANVERRTKEIGIRQAIGSSKRQLDIQFSIECFVHLLLAVFLSALFLVSFSPIIDSYFEGHILQELPIGATLEWVGLSVLVLMIAVMAYPAVVIARIRPALAVKGSAIKLRKGVGLWQALIAFQILVTAGLISTSLVVNQQLKMIRDTPVGYDAAHLVNVSQMSNTRLRERFKTELLTNSHILSASGVSHQLGGILYQSGYDFQVNGHLQTVLWQRLHTDFDFCKTYGIPIVAGRDFSDRFASDTTNFLINETACSQLGLTPDQALGIDVGQGGVRGKIVGVMKDFHFKTMHTVIEPLIVHIVPDRIRMLTVLVDNATSPETLSWMERKWKEIDPDTPFVFNSMEQASTGGYGYEKRFSKLIILFTLIVAVLSIGGLISLNVYVINLKRKEVGIKKILGAGLGDLCLDFTRRFLIISSVGFILSVPLSIYSLRLWLSGFAYRVNLAPASFLLTGLLIIVLALLSVCFPILNAATKNPLHELRAE